MSLESLNTCGCSYGLITSLTASRLVVPTWTPSLASARSASERRPRRPARTSARSRPAAPCSTARRSRRARPAWRDRDLVDVEVELLRAGRIGGVERHDRPLDVGRPKPELVRDRVGDGALEALAVRRVVVLEVRRVGGLVGADGERAGGDERELVGRARVGRPRRVAAAVGRRGGLLVVVGAAGGGGERRAGRPGGRAGSGARESFPSGRCSCGSYPRVSAPAARAAARARPRGRRSGPCARASTG